MKSRLKVKSRIKKTKKKPKKSKKEIDCSLYFAPEGVQETTTTSTTNRHSVLFEDLQKKQGKKLKLVSLNTDTGQLKEATTLSFNAKALGHSTRKNSNSTSTTNLITSSTTPHSRIPSINVDENAKKVTVHTTTTDYVPVHEIPALGFDAKHLSHSNAAKNNSSTTKSSTTKTFARDTEKVPTFIPQTNHNKLVSYNKVKPLKEMPVLSLIASALHSTPSTFDPSPADAKELSMPMEITTLKPKPLTQTYTYTTECIVIVKDIKEADKKHNKRRRSKIKKRRELN